MRHKLHLATTLGVSLVLAACSPGDETIDAPTSDDLRAKIATSEGAPVGSSRDLSVVGNGDSGIDNDRDQSRKPDRKRTLVRQEDLPPTVEDTFRVFLATEAPGLTIKELQLKTKRGRSVYEFEMEQDGRHVEIEVTPDGQIVELERELEPTAESLPTDVRSSLDFYLRQMVDPVIESVEYEDEEGDPAEYEIRVVGSNGQEMRIDIGLDGEVLRERSGR